MRGKAHMNIKNSEDYGERYSISFDGDHSMNVLRALSQYLLRTGYPVNCQVRDGKAPLYQTVVHITEQDKIILKLKFGEIISWRKYNE